MEAQISQFARRRSGKPLVVRHWSPSPFLVRVIFSNLEESSKDEEVSVTLFRRVFRRLIDSFDPSIPVNLEAFGSAKNSHKMTWADVRTAVDEGHLPKVQLSWTQSFFVTLEDSSSSWLSLIYHTLIYTAILVNICVLMLDSVQLERLEGWQHVLDIAFKVSVRLFVFDYFARALSVMSCPLPLIDEAWLIDTVSSSNLSSRSLHTSPSERLSHWATQPSNIVDFLSIIPALLSMLVIKQVHTPLSVLRMLRLLRVIRVLRAFKAVGKWVTTLQVLGEAFYSSLGAILVLAIYICLFSMVAGAILYQQEHNLNDAYEDSPAAMRSVVELFVGKSFSVSYSIVSALVLACVGMFKGIIFLLPMEKVKAATHNSQARFDLLNDLRRQVEMEENSYTMAWIEDFDCPSVRVKVRENTPNATSAPFIGNLNVPLWETEAVDVAVQVPLNGPRGLFQRRPEVMFLLQWHPSTDKSGAADDQDQHQHYQSYHSHHSHGSQHYHSSSSSSHDRPQPFGELKITALNGVGFPSGRQWIIELEVPKSLYGDFSTERWTSGTSVKGASNTEPAWEPATGHCTFHIDWRSAGEAFSNNGSNNANGNNKQSGKSPQLGGGTPSAEVSQSGFTATAGYSQDFERQVLSLLQSQNERFMRLEKQVSRLEKALAANK